MSHVVIFASTSGIANAVAEAFINKGKAVLLCARNEEAVKCQVKDLKVKYEVEAPYILWDLRDMGGHEEKVKQVFSRYQIDGVFMAGGVMYSKGDCESKQELLEETIQVNFVSIAVILNYFAQQFAEKGSGFISCVSSVAGDRGRQSNYAYGSSKAGLSAYLQGMRNRFFKKGVLIQTVKPGFVKTAMTDHMAESPLMVSPEKAAADILNGIEKRKDVLYTPFFWRPIMWLIIHIPEIIFKRLSL